MSRVPPPPPTQPPPVAPYPFALRDRMLRHASAPTPSSAASSTAAQIAATGASPQPVTSASNAGLSKSVAPSPSPSPPPPSRAPPPPPPPPHASKTVAAIPPPPPPALEPDSPPPPPPPPMQPLEEAESPGPLFSPQSMLRSRPRSGADSLSRAPSHSNAASSATAAVPPSPPVAPRVSSQQHWDLLQSVSSPGAAASSAIFSPTPAALSSPSPLLTNSSGGGGISFLAGAAHPPSPLMIPQHNKRPSGSGDQLQQHGRALSISQGQRRTVPPPLPITAQLSSPSQVVRSPSPLLLPGRRSALSSLSVEPSTPSQTAISTVGSHGGISSYSAEPPVTPYTPSSSPPSLAVQSSPSPASSSSGGGGGGSGGGAPNAATRAKIEAEILSTEVTYLNNLQHFVSEFILPLRARLSAGSNAGISSEDLAAIASNVESLCSFHILFLRELQVESEIALSAHTHPNLARIFQAYADWFKLYVSYLNNYSAMIHALDHARKTNPKFAKFVTEEFAGKPRRDSVSTSQAARGHAVVLGKGVVVGGIVAPQGNTVASAANAVASAAASSAQPQSQQQPQQQSLGPMDYLIQPVQRLPRYVLLLSSLLRHTPPSDTLHYSTIQAALAKIESIAAFVNERKRDAENMARLCVVAEHISGGLPEDIHLLQPHRRLVREGAVMVLSSKSLLGFDLLGSSLKVSRANLLLFNDLLIWTNEKGKYKGGFDLAQTTVSCGGGGGGGAGGAGPITGGAAGASGATLDSMFQISDPKANVLCKCNTPEEMRSWTEQLQQTIATFQQEKEAKRTRQRVLKARSRKTDHSQRRDLHHMIMAAAAGDESSSAAGHLQPEEGDDDPSVLVLSPDPQLEDEYLEQQAASARRRSGNQAHMIRAAFDQSGSSGGTGAAGSVGGFRPPAAGAQTLGGLMLPREVMAQLALKMQQNALHSHQSSSGSSSSSGSAAGSAVHSTATTVHNSLSSSLVNSRAASRAASRRGSFSAVSSGASTTASTSGSGAGHGAIHDRNSSALLIDREKERAEEEEAERERERLTYRHASA